MKSNEIKKIVKASKEVIKREGYKGYLHLVREKLKKREFTVIDPSTDTVPKFSTLTPEQEDILEQKMVWIFAPPRSGTTWLGSQLLNHPENIIWYEPWIGFHLGIINDDKNISGEDLPFERIYDTMAASSSYFFSPYHKKNWLPALRKFILTRAYSESQTFEKNLIIKEPVGSHSADIIMECFPNSKLIFLLRDGRDVVDSRIDMHRKGSWANLSELVGPMRRKQSTRWYSYQWNKLIERINDAYQNHDPTLRLLVRYENLKNNTFEELKKIYKFLNVKISDDELKKKIQQHDFKRIPSSKKGAGKFYRTASHGGWKENFTREEQELMNSIMGKTLREFGYEI